MKTAHQLDEFRRFRHVVRNGYAEYLEPDASVTWRASCLRYGID